MRTPRGCCLPGCFTQPEAQKCSLPGMWGTNSPPCPRPPLHRGEFHIPLCTGISAPLSPLGVSQPHGAKRKAIKSPIKPAGVGVVQPGGLDHLGKPQILTPPNFVVPPGLAYICEGLKEQRRGLVTLVLWNNQLTHSGMAYLGMTLVSAAPSPSPPPRAPFSYIPPPRRVSHTSLFTPLQTLQLGDGAQN